jgi:hypothetical protein
VEGQFIYLTEEQQRGSEKKHKAEAVCDTTDTREVFLYSALPGFSSDTREKDDGGGMREKRPAAVHESSHVS